MTVMIIHRHVVVPIVAIMIVHRRHHRINWIYNRITYNRIRWHRHRAMIVVMIMVVAIMRCHTTRTRLKPICQFASWCFWSE